MPPPKYFSQLSTAVDNFPSSVFWREHISPSNSSTSTPHLMHQLINVTILPWSQNADTFHFLKES